MSTISEHLTRSERRVCYATPVSQFTYDPNEARELIHEYVQVLRVEGGDGFAKAKVWNGRLKPTRG